tara:strand:+ start:2609 stop:3670 length:1062 start_codon:yes stop_codon:yes gene_type:complete
MASFANRYVAVQREGATYGTGAGAVLYGFVDDENLKQSYDIIERNDMSYWSAHNSAVGKQYTEGDLNFVLQADDFCGMLVYCAMGGDNAVSSGTHNFVEKVSNDLPSFSVTVGRDDRNHSFTGMMVSRMSISATAGEYVTASFSLIGKSEGATTALATPDWGVGDNKSGANAVDGMHFKDSSVRFMADAQDSIYVRSFTIELNNNLDTDNACALGSDTFTRKPIMQRREVSGTLEFTRPLYDTTGGTATPSMESEPTYNELTAAGGLEDANTTYAVKLILSDGTNATNILLYNVRYEAPQAGVSGRDAETMSVGFKAYMNLAAGMANVETMQIDWKTANTGTGSGNTALYSVI